MTFSVDLIDYLTSQIFQNEYFKQIKWAENRQNVFEKQLMALEMLVSHIDVPFEKFITYLTPQFKSQLLFNLIHWDEKYLLTFTEKFKGGYKFVIGTFLVEAAPFLYQNEYIGDGTCQENALLNALKKFGSLNPDVKEYLNTQLYPILANIVWVDELTGKLSSLLLY